MIFMKIFNKHGEVPPPIVKADFSGGLNTANQVDAIAENQLADVLNMEIDFATKKLQTVCGTKDILSAEKIFAGKFFYQSKVLAKKIFEGGFDDEKNFFAVSVIDDDFYFACESKCGGKLGLYFF